MTTLLDRSYWSKNLLTIYVFIQVGSNPLPAQPSPEHGRHFPHIQLPHWFHHTGPRTSLQASILVLILVYTPEHSDNFFNRHVHSKSKHFDPCIRV
jgi:hypothetical protein